MVQLWQLLSDQLDHLVCIEHWIHGTCSFDILGCWCSSRCVVMVPSATFNLSLNLLIWKNGIRKGVNWTNERAHTRMIQIFFTLFTWRIRSFFRSSSCNRAHGSMAEGEFHLHRRMLQREKEMAHAKFFSPSSLKWNYNGISLKVKIEK